MGVEVAVYLFDPRPYEESILPAYRKFLEKSDTRSLVSLIQSVLPEVRTGKRNSYWSPEVYEEDIAILTGKQSYSPGGKQVSPTDAPTLADIRLLIDNSVGPSLVELLCLPEDRGAIPKQSMSRTALDNYLYAHSRWIEEYFTGSKEVSGPVLEIKIGEWSRFFAAEEVEAFDTELSRMPSPNDPQVLEDGFNNLRSLVRAAKQDPNLMLLYVIM